MAGSLRDVMLDRAQVVVLELGDAMQPSLLCLVVPCFVAWLCLGRAWAIFVDDNEHTPWRIRDMLLRVLFVATVVEVALAVCGVTYMWVAGVAFFANGWGTFDAIIRFPLTRRPSLFLVCKVFSVHVVKTLGYIFGCTSLGKYISVFVLLIFFDVCFMPMLLLMATPLDSNSRSRLPSPDDVDLVVQICRLLARQSARRQFCAACDKWAWQTLADTGLGVQSSGGISICGPSGSPRKPEGGRTYRAV